jgi:hypothetical protein
MPGADCPEDGGCPSGYFTQSQTHHCCEDTDSDRRCGPNGDCCLNDFTVAPESSVLNCIINGKPCTRAYPCCTNTCRNGVCICRADDEPCTQHKECCSLTCYAATGTCKTLGAG